MVRKNRSQSVEGDFLSGIRWTCNAKGEVGRSQIYDDWYEMCWPLSFRGSAGTRRVLAHMVSSRCHSRICLLFNSNLHLRSAAVRWSEQIAHICSQLGTRGSSPFPHTPHLERCLNLEIVILAKRSYEFTQRTEANPLR